MARRNSIMVSRTVYQIGVVTLVASIVWVAISAYLAVSKTTLTDVNAVILEPVSPALDQNVMQKLSERFKVSTDLVDALQSSESAVSAASGSATIESVGQ